MAYNDFGEYYDDGSEAGNTGVLTRPDNYTRDPSGGNWGLPEGDWIDRYPGSEQDVIRSNYHPANAAPAQGAPPATTPGTPQQSAQDFIRQWQQSHPVSEGIDGLLNALKAAGYTNVSRFQYGNTPSNNELSIDGQKFKVLAGEEGGSPSWYMGTGESESSSAGGSGAPASWDYPDFDPGEFGYTPFEAPDAFSYGDYKAPTAADAEAEPGYAFGRDQAMKAATNSASATGLARSGGFLKGLMEYGQGLAGQQYKDVEGRARGAYETNRFNAADVYNRGYKNKLTENMMQYNQAADKYNRSAGTYGINLNKEATRRGFNQGQGNDYWNHLLSLYDISSRTLPSAPTPPQSNYNGMGS